MFFVKKCFSFSKMILHERHLRHRHLLLANNVVTTSVITVNSSSPTPPFLAFSLSKDSCYKVISLNKNMCNISFVCNMRNDSNTPVSFNTFKMHSCSYQIITKAYPHYHKIVNNNCFQTSGAWAWHSWLSRCLYLKCENKYFKNWI